MDKFFQSAFDFFSYAIPGFVIVFIILFFNIDLSDQDLIEGILKNINATFALVLLIPSYIIGFLISPLGRFIYSSMNKYLWKQRHISKLPLHISEKYALVRQFSSSNFKYVESWNMFCTMSHNLAVASLLTLILAVIKVIKHSPDFFSVWVMLIPISLCSFFIFIYRAITFKHWAKNDLNSTITSLNLIEKGKNFK